MSVASVFKDAASDGERTLADRAFVLIHEAIVSGRLTPGERLPIEDLAAELGMSPMPVREALRRLDSVGLVQNIPHRGARVTELSIEDLAEVYEARLALEPLAIRHAAERCADEDADQIRAAWAALRAVDKESFKAWTAHRDFHFALYATARSAWLTRLITPLWESSERYRLATPVKDTMKRRVGEHKAMLDAVVGHEPELASRLLYNHLATTANEVAADMGHEKLFDLLEPAPALVS